MISRGTRLVVTAGVLSGLAFILYFLEFPLAMLFPPFLKIDFSDVPAILGGIAGGPLMGIAIQLVKNLLHFLIISKEPLASGEIANFCAGVSFMLPIIFLVRRNAKFSPTPYAMGTVAATLIMCLVNYFVTLPLYGMAEHNARIGFIATAGLPFNLLKWTLVSVATAVVYVKVKGPMARLTLKRV